MADKFEKASDMMADTRKLIVSLDGVLISIVAFSESSSSVVLKIGVTSFFVSALFGILHLYTTAYVSQYHALKNDISNTISRVRRFKARRHANGDESFAKTLGEAEKSLSSLLEVKSVNRFDQYVNKTGIDHIKMDKFLVGGFLLGLFVFVISMWGLDVRLESVMRDIFDHVVNVVREVIVKFDFFMYNTSHD